MLQIQITVDASQFVAWAEEAETRINNASPFFESLQQWTADQLRQHMADQQGPSGPFAPLKPRYAAEKNRHFPGMPILQRTQAMLDSITPGSDASSVWAQFTDPVAWYHQIGTYKMLARPPAYVTDAKADEFTQRVADWAIGGETGAAI